MDAFHEVRLPARLAFGSTGGVERRTEITTLASGFERRSTPWALGRRRYLIGANLRSLDDMAELVAFFEARRGRLYGFRFKDFGDFKSCAPGGAVSAEDQEPGGTGFSEALFVARGLHDRPWSPSGLMVETSAEGLAIRWTPRVRLFGDSWDGEPTTVDPMRFRLRVVDHDIVVRTMAVEGLSASYPAADLAADFPEGATSMARIAVAQWGEGFGWGPEAEVEAEIRRV